MSNKSVTFNPSSEAPKLSSALTLEATRYDGPSILGFRFPPTWPTGTTIYFLEGDGQAAPGICPLVTTTGALITMTNMDADVGAFNDGKTVKDPSFASMFYGITTLFLYADPAPNTPQTVEVIVDKI